VHSCSGPGYALSSDFFVRTRSSAEWSLFQRQSNIEREQKFVCACFGRAHNSRARTRKRTHPMLTITLWNAFLTRFSSALASHEGRSAVFPRAGVFAIGDPAGYRVLLLRFPPPKHPAGRRDGAAGLWLRATAAGHLHETGILTSPGRTLSP